MSGGYSERTSKDGKRSHGLQARFGDPYGTLVPEGRYWVRFVGWERGSAYGSERWFAWFLIAQAGTGEGKPVVRFYNAPKGPRVAMSSNLGQDHVRITGCRPPADLVPDFLKGPARLAHVATVERTSDGTGSIKLERAEHYSKIGGFVAAWEAPREEVEPEGRKE